MNEKDWLLFVGLLELASKQPCVCLSLPESEKPCIVCQATTRKAKLEQRREVSS